MNVKKAIKSSLFAPIVLFIVSIVLFGVFLLTNRGDLTSGVLLLCGVITLITAIFLLSGVERMPYPAEITELAMVSSVMENASQLSELGVTSDSVYRYTSEGKIVKINPVSAGNIPAKLPKDVHFVTGDDWSGIVSVPSSAMLWDKLKNVDKLQVPVYDFDGIERCISEVFVDMAGFSRAVSTTLTAESAVVVLQNFRMAKKCVQIHTVSKKCCTMSGCPVCALAASILAEGIRKDIVSSSVTIEKDKLTMVFTIV